MRFVLVLVVLTFIATQAQAGLPAGSWPQARRDAARSGLALEPIPESRVRLRWSAPTGETLSGEPAALDCTAAVVDGGGRVHAFNARSGAPLWTHERPWAIEPVGVVSALALDDAGRLHAGLPADPLLVRAWRALVDIHVALYSRAIDENSFPVGPELAAALTPTYIRSLPPNPITGRVMVHSEVPSPGDYRYRQENSGGGFRFAVWGSDEGVLDFGEACDAGPIGGPAPDWPLSAERGGTATTLEAADGTLVHRELDFGNALVLVPGLGDDGVDWASLEETPTYDGGWIWGGRAGRLERTGRVRLTDGDGLPAWESQGWGPIRGGAALAADGTRILARGSTPTGSALMTQARNIATAIESYSIDNNAYPPAGDLEDDLVPIYISCMPLNLFRGDSVVHSASPSPGDYRYEPDPTLTSYTLSFWDSRGDVALIFDTGSIVQSAEDEPAAVDAIAADGSLRWHAELFADPAGDTSSPSLLPSGAALVATSRGDVVALELADGSERWRVDAGGPVSLAPALRPDGGFVVVTDGGWVVAFGPGGDELWSVWVGAPVVAAPITGADGGVLVADLDGTLTAFEADGRLRWRSYLGGPFRAGLTTTPILSDGWIFVGRSDGTLLAAVPEVGGGRPADPVRLFATGEKGPGLVGFTWDSVAAPAVPGAHWHFRRWRDELFGPGEDLLPDHPSQDAGYRDEAAAGDLLFYTLVAADCGENLSGPGLY